MPRKYKPLSEREDLVQVTKFSDLKIGDLVVYGLIPGKERELKIEAQPNKARQVNYANFWKQCIKDGIVYKYK